MYNVFMNCKLSTETSPMSHVTVSVDLRSLSYWTGGDLLYIVHKNHTWYIRIILILTSLNTDNKMNGFDKEM